MVSAFNHDREGGRRVVPVIMWLRLRLVAHGDRGLRGPRASRVSAAAWNPCDPFAWTAIPVAGQRQKAHFYIPEILLVSSGALGAGAYPPAGRQSELYGCSVRFFFFFLNRTSFECPEEFSADIDPSFYRVPFRRLAAF